MKKTILCVVVCVSLLFISGACLGFNGIKINVNGKEIRSDVLPQIVNDRVMVPIRVVAEALNCEVTWDQSNSTVNISNNNVSCKFLKINGEQTAFPYWEEDGKIYMEAHNTVDLIRRFYSNRRSIWLSSSGIQIDTKECKLSSSTHDNFRTILVSGLNRENILNVNWDDQNKNLIVSMP